MCAVRSTPSRPNQSVRVQLGCSIRCCCRAAVVGRRPAGTISECTTTTALRRQAAHRITTCMLLHISECSSLALYRVQSKRAYYARVLHNRIGRIGLEAPWPMNMRVSSVRPPRSAMQFKSDFCTRVPRTIGSVNHFRAAAAAAAVLVGLGCFVS